MTASRLLGMAGLLLAGALHTATAATIGALQDGGLGQSSVLQKGNENGLLLNGFDRFSEPFFDGSIDLGLLASGSAAQAVYATGGSVRVTYGGTAAPQEAQLLLGANPGDLLFDTRGSGCGFADWQADELCAIDAVSDWREISGLAAGQALVFSLQGQALANAGAYDQLAAQWFSDAGAARWVNLGNGRLMLGFELGDNADFADWVFTFDGLSLNAPGSSVPEPTALGLVLLAGLLAARRRHRP